MIGQNVRHLNMELRTHMSLRSEFRVEMSNILSYHMSVRSEFYVEMSNILSYHMMLDISTRNSERKDI
jgi:hypothetical protein